MYKLFYIFQDFQNEVAEIRGEIKICVYVCFGV